MNLVAMNIDTFEERLLQRNSLLGPLLTTDCGAFLEFFYVLHCLRLNILPRVRNQDSGKFFIVESGIRENFLVKSEILRLWNPEYSSRNPDSNR